MLKSENNLEIHLVSIVPTVRAIEVGLGRFVCILINSLTLCIDRLPLAGQIRREAMSEMDVESCRYIVHGINHLKDG